MLDWFANRWNDFVDFLWRIVLSVFDMLKDLFIWILEALMDLAILLIDGISYLFDGLATVGTFGSLPPETTNMLSMLGVAEGLGLIVTALTIRLLLQLIPFVRLGS